MPLFSIIIPTYNRMALLQEALDSVLDQSFIDYELIVVDDGSSDGTASMVQSHGGPIRYISQPNRGPGAARNRGVEHARADFVLFLDSDDLLFPWTLETYARVIAEYGRPTCLLGRAVRFSDRATLADYSPEAVRARPYRDFLEAGQRPHFFGIGYSAINRASLLAVGGITTTISVFEDQDLGLRFGGERCVVVEGPVTVAYRETPGSLTANPDLALAGIRYLIASERRGAYPGGLTRRWERRNYIAFSIRSVSFSLVRAKLWAKAWSLYRWSLYWHVRLGRIRYLVGFPLLLVAGLAGLAKRESHHANK